MADFDDNSLCLKLTMMLISAGFSMHLFSMDNPYGWSGYQTFACDLVNNGNNGVDSRCNDHAVRAVQAFEVIGFLSALTALFLSLCLVLFDELKGNRLVLACLCAFSLLAGLTIIIGIAIYEGTTNVYTNGSPTDGSEFASTVAVVAGICALLGGTFCILELVGVGVK